MTVAARVDPGPGLRRATTHLRDVMASAGTDIRDDATRHVLIDAIADTIRDLEADPSKVEAQHAAGIDVTKSVRIRIPACTSPTAEVRKRHHALVVRLREHGWITHPTQHGDLTTYRCARGDVLMIAPTRRSGR
jgi:hypothetical protein